MANVHVAVRVRPFNKREKELGCKNVVRIVGKEVELVDPTDATKASRFTYDHSYNSFSEDDDNFASQANVFEDLGRLYLENAWQGYNSSIFAYGQTGAGKSYSMMGASGDPGIIPLGCEELFKRCATMSAASSGMTFTVEISYLEIYNEVIRDLLNPQKNNEALKVRQSPKVGVYVQGLSKLVAQSFEDIEHFLDMGGKERTTAATKMNQQSSRSHAVLTIYFTQSKEVEGGEHMTKVSKINLIDLAGSERQEATGTTGVRLKEACSINKSLSALSGVISALAARSTNSKKKSAYVPYRDSVLTQLLSESLGGNARSIMIAAISPASINYKESLSTLKYASRAKCIVNQPKVNEEGEASKISALKGEVARLKALIASGIRSAEGLGPTGEGGQSATSEADIKFWMEQVQVLNALIAELRMTIDEKTAQTQGILREREKILQDQGLSMEALGHALGTSDMPYLVNLNPDTTLSQSLVYYLRPGATKIGMKPASFDGDMPDIVLSGLGVVEEHCVIDTGDPDQMVQDVVITPGPKGRTYVNGKQLLKAEYLVHGSRVIMGKSFVFRFVNAKEAAILRARAQSEGREVEDEFEWEDAIREMSSVFGVGSGGGESNEKLVRAAFLADEANDIAQSLGKRAVFAVDLKPINEAASDGGGGLLLPSALDGNEESVSQAVSIRCTNLYTGVSTIVPVSSFARRVEAMYEVFVSAETGLDPTAAAAADDPFFDPPPDVLIGTADLPLASLARLKRVDMRLPIVAGNGADAGELSVSISLLEPGSYADLPICEDPRQVVNQDVVFVLTLAQVTGLPERHNCGVFVRYCFPDDEAEVTERSRERTSNPTFDYKDSFDMHITEEFLAYLTSSTCTFEVWGREPLQTADHVVDMPASAPSSQQAALIEMLTKEKAELEVMNKQLLIEKERAFTAPVRVRDTDAAVSPMHMFQMKPQSSRQPPHSLASPSSRSRAPPPHGEDPWGSDEDIEDPAFWADQPREEEWDNLGALETSHAAASARAGGDTARALETDVIVARLSQDKIKLEAEKGKLAEEKAQLLQEKRDMAIAAKTSEARLTSELQEERTLKEQLAREKLVVEEEKRQLAEAKSLAEREREAAQAQLATLEANPPKSKTCVVL